jgi:O-acetyl-ADP-ribose deacetylase (regulator of RNase III)
MIVNMNGNILDSGADVIFHQVNCQQKMSSGIAKQIRQWCPKHYDDYIAFIDACKRANLSPLGQFIMTDTGNSIQVCGIFGQEFYGNDGKCYTDYAAVRSAFQELKDMADKYDSKRKRRWAVPYKMSCGLAGGNWNVMMRMFKELFGSSENITLEIWKLK